ncbi:MAG: RNA-binding S4 domain-containing protein [Acidobacteriota bacterium]
MRVDLFLKVSRLVVRRTVAAEMCRAGAVLVNGSAAKAGREIKSGDTISLRRRGQILQVRVLDLPSGNVSKGQAASLYEVLGSQPYCETDEL